MAKGAAIVANIRGKLGNNVFYQLKNSNNKITQGVRVYQPEVSNPRSAGQMAQRIKLLAANNMYRAFNDICDHSFEGVPVGGRSHQEFMKAALSMESGFPYIIKGTTGAVPGAYLMSRGSLTPLSASCVDIGGWGLAVPFPSELNPSNFGDFSLGLIDANPFLRDGDQITILFLLRKSYEVADVDQGFVYIPFKHRFILDTTSLDTLASVGIDDFQYSVASGTLYLNIAGATPDDIVAGCVIVSRYSPSGKKWLRCTARMQVSGAVLSSVTSAAAYDLAVKSYLVAQTTPQSEYYLNGADESAAGSSDSTPLELVSSAIDFAGSNVDAAVVLNGPTGVKLGAPILYRESDNYLHLVQLLGNALIVVSDKYAQSYANAFNEVNSTSIRRAPWNSYSWTLPTVEERP